MSSRQFVTTFSDILRRQPYYQCGVAIKDSKTHEMLTAKFSSQGKLDEQPQSEDEVYPSQKEEQNDYGYREKCFVPPTEDCFYKLN